MIDDGNIIIIILIITIISIIIIVPYTMYGLGFRETKEKNNKGHGVL